MAPLSSLISFATLALAVSSVSGALHNTRSRQHSAQVAARRAANVGAIAERHEVAPAVAGSERSARAGKRKNRKRCGKHSKGGSAPTSSSVPEVTSAAPAPKVTPTTTAAPAPKATGSGQQSGGGGTNQSGGGGDSSSSGGGSTSSSGSGSGSGSTSGSGNTGGVSGLTQVQLPGGFSGTNSGGIGSWFDANSGQDSTNGRSWCNNEYDDSQPLFAPDILVMSPSGATYYTNPTQWAEDAGKYCGLEALVTYNGKTVPMYIGDAFDHAWVKTQGSIDILHNAWADLYGSWSDDKSVVMTDVSWVLTGYKNEQYAYHP